MTARSRLYAKHRFDQPAHEARRLARLRQAYAVKALFICSKDRAQWLESIRGYRRSGGSLVSPNILLSCVWAALPKGAGEMMRAAVKSLRALSAPRQKTPGTPSR